MHKIQNRMITHAKIVSAMTCLYAYWQCLSTINNADLFNSCKRFFTDLPGLRFSKGRHITYVKMRKFQNRRITHANIVSDITCLYIYRHALTPLVMQIFLIASCKGPSQTHFFTYLQVCLYRNTTITECHYQDGVPHLSSVKPTEALICTNETCVFCNQWRYEDFADSSLLYVFLQPGHLPSSNAIL